jgi:acyl-coenzyme A thioesterase PaaI-like protein
MFKPHILLQKAQHSALYRRLLNIALSRIIPFNAPHHPRIEKITDDGIEISLPYIRKNLNHLKGLHACALAALSEYACGLTLIKNFHAGEYRLIMKELQMTYHYQGREAAITRFSIPKDVNAAIKDTLTREESVFRSFEIDTYDISGNHRCQFQTI